MIRKAPEGFSSRKEFVLDAARVVLPRLALGATCLVGGAYLLWGTAPEPASQTPIEQHAQPSHYLHNNR
jgi:hypothetical protein